MRIGDGVGDHWWRVSYRICPEPQFLTSLVETNRPTNRQIANTFCLNYLTAKQIESKIPRTEESPRDGMATGVEFRSNWMRKKASDLQPYAACFFEGCKVERPIRIARTVYLRVPHCSQRWSTVPDNLEVGLKHPLESAPMPPQDGALTVFLARFCCRDRRHSILRFPTVWDWVPRSGSARQ